MDAQVVHGLGGWALPPGPALGVSQPGLDNDHVDAQKGECLTACSVLLSEQKAARCEH
jgi:hypothetical protein